MPLDTRKTKVQQKWETSFEGFSELSGSAGSVLLSNSSCSDARDTAGQTETNEQRCATPPNILEDSLLSVPETPHASAHQQKENLKPSAKATDHNVEIQHPKSPLADRPALGASGDAEPEPSDIDTFLSHIMRQYGSASPTRAIEGRIPLDGSVTTVDPAIKPSGPRRRVKLIKSQQTSAAGAVVPFSPGVDSFLKEILSKSCGEKSASVYGQPSGTRDTDNGHPTIQASQPDESNDDGHLSAGVQVGDVSTADLDRVDMTMPKTPQLYSAAEEIPTTGEPSPKGSDVPASLHEQITYLTPTQNHAMQSRTSAASPGAPPYSQCIESVCSSVNTSVSEEFSQPPLPSQLITSQKSGGSSPTGSESDSSLLWTPLSATSVDQTPGIHVKVEQTTPNPGHGVKPPVMPTRQLRFVKGGLAEKMHRTIQREHSNYAVNRHTVTLRTPAGTCSPIPDPPSFSAVVISKPSPSVMKCRVLDGDASLLGDCHVVTSSGLQGVRINPRDRVKVYQPWQLKTYSDVGRVVFSTSYCEVTESTHQTDSFQADAVATPTSTVLGRKSCPCNNNGDCPLFPRYTGPYAMLHQ